MITTEQFLLNLLTDRGMSDTQADEVMKIAKPCIVNTMPEYQINWDNDCNENHDVMYRIWWPVLKEKALIWLNENKPEAWFKPIFEG